MLHPIKTSLFFFRFLFSVYRNIAVIGEGGGEIVITIVSALITKVNTEYYKVKKLRI